MAISVTAANVRPLEGAIIRLQRAGGTVAMGDAAYVASDGDWERARANTAATSLAAGVVVGVNENAETTAADGDAISTVTFGPVSGFSGMTPGGLVYLDSASAGGLVQTAPTGSATWTRVVGYAETAEILFVMPGIVAPVSNS